MHKEKGLYIIDKTHANSFVSFVLFVVNESK